MRRRKLRITQNNFCLLFWQKLFIIHYVAPPFKICRTVVRQILEYRRGEHCSPYFKYYYLINFFLVL